MLFRHDTLREIAAYVRRHPGDAILFPIQFYRIGPRDSALAFIRHQNRFAELETTMGHKDELVGTHIASVASPCELPASFLRGSGFGSVQALAARYRSAATRVLIFVAPIPACTNAAPIMGRAYSEVGALPPRELAPSSFIDDHWFAHAVPDAVPAFTHMLAESVRAALDAQTPDPQQASSSGPSRKP